MAEFKPLMVMPCPVASIVKLPGEVFAIAGSVLPSVISPLTLKLIVSCPVPAAQVLLASEVLLLALLIAARRLHSVGSPRVVGRVDRYRIAGRVQFRLDHDDRHRHQHHQQNNQHPRTNNRSRNPKK